MKDYTDRATRNGAKVFDYRIDSLGVTEQDLDQEFERYNTYFQEYL